MPDQELARGYRAAIREMISSDSIRVPAYPAVALRISALIQRDDYHLEDLANLVGNDQALSMEMLRLVNSAAYWSSSPVSSSRVAVARIGARQVAALALALGLGTEAKTAGPLDSLRRQFWQEGVTSALLCQKLAVLRRAPPEDAFTCGLLHDFGRVIAVTCLEQLLKSRPPAEPQLAEWWDQLIESVHLQLGAVLARRWQLSPLLTDAMTLHHGDGTESAENPDILEAVVASDRIVALAARSSAVTSEDLESVSQLHSAAEREVIAQTLPLCPALLATFETSEKPNPESSSSLVSTPPSAGPLVPISLEVLDATHSGSTYRTTALGPNLLVVEGRAPMLVNRLVEMTIFDPVQRFSVWANPQSCEVVTGGYRVTLKPFALNGIALQRWSALLRI